MLCLSRVVCTQRFADYALLVVQVRKGYMRLIGQQVMVSPQGLMGDLLTQLEVTQLDESAPISLANVEEVLCSCYRPLLLYRLVRED